MMKRYLFLFVVGLFAVSAAVTVMGTNVVSALQTEVVSSYVDEELPLADPESSMWSQATSFDVPMSGQTVIAPTNTEPSVSSMTVRSLNNGGWIAFLLEWDDPTQDEGGDLTAFKDSAAIQFPSEPGQPFVCMGDSRNTVEILHWRADFQKDIESGMPNAADIFPNMWVNIYPGGDDPAFFTGRSAGNPLSAADKTTPVEDLLAGGFGTLTTELHNDSVGWAKWEDGKWKAVIARPMTTIDPEDAQFAGATETSIALAAWDGGKDEINGKKSVSTWVTLQIESPVASPSDAPAITFPPAEPPVVPPAESSIEAPDRLSGVTNVVLGIGVVALVLIAVYAGWTAASRRTR